MYPILCFDYNHSSDDALFTLQSPQLPEVSKVLRVKRRYYLDEVDRDYFYVVKSVSWEFDNEGMFVKAVAGVVKKE